MRILITGATGFIGRRLYKALKINSYSLRVVTRNTESNFENNPFYKSIKCKDEINVKDLSVYLIQEGFIQKATMIGNLYIEKAINNLKHFKSNEITSILLEIANSIK